MKNYAEEERFLSQPRKMLISSFTLENGTLITPLLLIIFFSQERLPFFQTLCFQQHLRS